MKQNIFATILALPLTSSAAIDWSATQIELTCGIVDRQEQPFVALWAARGKYFFTGSM